MSRRDAGLIPKKGTPQKVFEQGLVLFGVSLRDAREEHFVLMVCDGLPIGLAFKRAGFESKDHNAPSKLFHLPRVQERAVAILEARRSTGVVSLGEVTDMLKRVYAGAQSAEEYSAAHNAAFSLARLYGHVTDRATVEIIRRPSRDPDAPSEQALSSWVESLPVIEGSIVPQTGLEPPPHGAPAQLLGPQVSGPAMQPADAAPLYTPSANSAELSKDINADLRSVNPQIDWHGPGDGWSRTGNGAPPRPVTGTPDACGRTDPLGSPSGDKQVPVKIREKVAIEGVAEAPDVPISIPGFEELFG